MGDGLGSNPKICIDAFVEAMRTTMPDDQKAKLDRPEVRANIAPLGQAVFDIIIGPAQVHADDSTDSDFFEWLTALSQWANEIEAWRAALTENMAEPGPLAALRQNLAAVPQPPAPPGSPPAGITGKMR